jgi:hypothetical protein
MANQTPLAAHRVTTVQIWTHLAAEQRACVIRLMAQLAFKLVLAQPNSPLKEVPYAVECEQPQNPS